jgi:hypothetical protein
VVLRGAPLGHAEASPLASPADSIATTEAAKDEGRGGGARASEEEDDADMSEEVAVSEHGSEQAAAVARPASDAYPTVRMDEDIVEATAVIKPSRRDADWDDGEEEEGEGGKSLSSSKDAAMDI